MTCSHGLDHPELGDFLPHLYVPAGESIKKCMCTEKTKCKEMHQRHNQRAKRMRLPSYGRSKNLKNISQSHRLLISKLLDTNLPKDSSKHFLSALHFHPSTCTTDGNVFSYIHDERTAIYVYGKESAGKYIVPSSEGFPIPNCWFVLPTYEAREQRVTQNESILISDNESGDEEEVIGESVCPEWHESTSCHCCPGQDNIFLPPSLLQDISIIISDDEGSGCSDYDDDRDDGTPRILDVVHEASSRSMAHERTEEECSSGVIDIDLISKDSNLVTSITTTTTTTTPSAGTSVSHDTNTTNPAEIPSVLLTEKEREAILTKLCSIGNPAKRCTFETKGFFNFTKAHPCDYKKSRKSELTCSILAAVKGIAKILPQNVKMTMNLSTLSLNNVEAMKMHPRLEEI